MKKLIAIVTALVLALGLVCLTGCQPEETPGRVYFINRRPEADEAWQKLAQTYTESTGVEVKVVSVTPESYYAEVVAAMNSDWVPSMFQCVNAEDLKQWEGFALDLTDTAAFKACDDRGFDLRDAAGAVRGIGYAYQVYGIVVNTALLTQAEHTLEQITDFASLKAVAEDITARQEELQFSAFASSGADAFVAEQMINLPLYYSQKNGTEVSLDGFRNMWDLYLENGSCDAAQQEDQTAVHGYNDFVAGKAVFYHSDASVYDRLIASGMDAKTLTMIPLYCGAEGEEQAGLCCGTEDYLAVNAKAPQQDREATLKFLEWVATSDFGLETLAQQFGGVPFKKAKAPENVFFHAAGALYDAEKYTVTWEHMQLIRQDKWENAILPALQDYSLGRGDWTAVETAFADDK